MRAKIWTIRKSLTAPNSGTVTTNLMGVAEGVAVIAAYINVLTAQVGGTVTYEVGDGSDTDGFITNADIAATATGIKAGSGAYLAAASGKIYGSNDTIDLLTTVTAAATTAPVFGITIVCLQVYP